MKFFVHTKHLCMYLLFVMQGLVFCAPKQMLSYNMFSYLSYKVKFPRLEKDKYQILFYLSLLSSREDKAVAKKSMLVSLSLAAKETPAKYPAAHTRVWLDLLAKNVDVFDPAQVSMIGNVNKSHEKFAERVWRYHVAFHFNTNYVAAALHALCPVLPPREVIDFVAEDQRFSQVLNLSMVDSWSLEDQRALIARTCKSLVERNFRSYNPGKLTGMKNVSLDVFQNRIIRVLDDVSSPVCDEDAVLLLEIATMNGDFDDRLVESIIGRFYGCEFVLTNKRLLNLLHHLCLRHEEIVGYFLSSLPVDKVVSAWEGVLSYKAPPTVWCERVLSRASSAPEVIPGRWLRDFHQVVRKRLLNVNDSDYMFWLLVDGLFKSQGDKFRVELRSLLLSAKVACEVGG